MKVIAISGIIARFEFEEESNVTPASLKKSLTDANGEDILVTINSPGGSVFEGLEMFSLLRNYPGNVETRIISLAASMGSVLALAGNKKSAENTALYFIHNAQGIGIGDYRELLSESEFLKDVSSLIANLYAEFTSLTIKEAQQFMDDDSQFFGSDLELLGFDIIQTENEPNQAVARVNAKTRFADVSGKLAKDDQTYDLDKIAACLDFEKYGIKATPPAKSGAMNKIEVDGKIYDVKPDIPTANIPAEAGVNKREVNMTLSEFLRENSAANTEYIQAIADAEKRGEEKVNARVETAMSFLKAESSYPDTVKELALKVIKGEEPAGSLTAAVAGIDAVREEIKSTTAQKETGDQGDINAGAGDKNADDEANYQAKKERIRG